MSDDATGPAPLAEGGPLPLSYGDLWRAAESEFTRADVSRRGLFAQAADTSRPAAERALCRRVAMRRARDADAFAAIVRLIERVIADDWIKERLVEIARDEARAASERAEPSEQLDVDESAS